MKWELVERNVALNASQPQETQREQHPPSVEVVREVIEEATRQDTHGVGLLVRLAAATGARRGELVALRWRHVNLDAKTVLIESSSPRAQPRPAVARRRVRITAATPFAKMRPHHSSSPTTSETHCIPRDRRAAQGRHGAARSGRITRLATGSKRETRQKIAELERGEVLGSM